MQGSPFEGTKHSSFESTRRNPHMVGEWRPSHYENTPLRLSRRRFEQGKYTSSWKHVKYNSMELSVVLPTGLHVVVICTPRRKAKSFGIWDWCVLKAKNDLHFWPLYRCGLTSSVCRMESLRRLETFGISSSLLKYLQRSKLFKRQPRRWWLSAHCASQVFFF